MAPDSAHQETGAQIPPAPAEVEVTPSQTDAARLIIEIDSAAGRQTPGLIHKIAGARPSRRRSAIWPGGSPEEGPSVAANLQIELTPAPGKALRRSLRRRPRRRGQA